MCVPDARRTTHDCCCCHGDAVLRRSFVIRPAPDRPCAARVRPAASTTTADAPRCRLCAAVAARRLPPVRADRSLGFVGRQSSCCCSCRCEVDKAHRVAVEQRVGDGLVHVVVALCPSAECARPVGSSACAKANGGTSASARSSCAAAFEHRRESRTSVPAFGGRVRGFVGGTTSAGGSLVRDRRVPRSTAGLFDVGACESIVDAQGAAKLIATRSPGSTWCSARRSNICA